MLSRLGVFMVGRKIDKEQFEKLCNIQCTGEEIASWFGCSIDTLNDWCKANYEGQTFSKVFSQKAACGRISLRRSQWQKAVKETNTSMLIWLGKQYLNQVDKVENTNTEKVEFISDVKADIDPESDR